MPRQPIFKVRAVVTEDRLPAGHPQPGPARRLGSCRKARRKRAALPRPCVSPLGPERRLLGDRGLSSHWTPG